MRKKISKYMSYVNLFVGLFLILISIINGLNWLFILIGSIAVLISSASIYLKKKVLVQGDFTKKQVKPKK